MPRKEAKMFKQFALKRKTLLLLATFLLFSILIISIKTIVAQGQDRPNSHALPTDVSSTYQINNDATSTPDATQQAQYRMTVYPTPTNIPISKYTDLSPNIKDEDKFTVLVKHANGSYEQFSVGPLRPYTPILSINELPDYILAEIPLQPGDEIIAWSLPDNLFRAEGTARPTTTQSIINPTQILSTPTSYPYP
jgi:hypothetical protein